MMRILIVDDERHVIDTIAHIVRTELADRFDIAGSASSGRQAIVLTMERKPDIVIMDVRMPGVSGIEAIRELRKRGSSAAFILATAYERFDIAQEAVGLGVVEYLLKPVGAEALAAALQRAAAIVSERSTLESRDLESREREAWTRDFAEAALLYGMALGERFGDRLERYRIALGLDETHASLGVVAVAGSSVQESVAIHDRLRDSLRYKTRVLVGPLAAGRCVVLIPLRSADDPSAEVVRTILTQEFSAELAGGTLRFALGSAVPIADSRLSFAQAMEGLVSARSAARHTDQAAATPVPPGFGDEETIIEALASGEPERARLAFETLLAAAVDRRDTTDEAEPARLDAIVGSRIMSLFGQIVRALLARDGLEPAAALAGIDISGLASAMSDTRGPGAAAFEDLARSKFEALVAGIIPGSSHSPAVARALDFIADNYGRQISLDQAADAVGLSPNRLSKLFVAETGRGFSDSLIEYRIQRARSLLRVPGASIKRVSLECGYPDSNYFSRLFKKMTGRTPSDYSSGTVEDIDEAN